MKRFGKVFLITLLAVSMVLGMAGSAGAVSTTRVYLGAADSFAILSGAGITDDGGTVAGGSMILAGDVGTYPSPGAAIGLLISQLTSGVIYDRDGTYPYPGPRVVVNDGLLLEGKNALTAAYNDARDRTPFETLVGTVPTDNQLNRVLYPGVYQFGHADTANLTGTLTLDANGDPNPVWIFQATSDLIIASNSNVVFANTGTPCDVFWQVSTSATIGTDTNFVGNIMADQSIALQTRATLLGSAQARIGSVTLDDNDITKGPCALAPPVTPVTPGLPYTGLDGVSRVLPWNIVGLIIAIALLGLFSGLLLFTSRRAKKETS